MLEILKKLYDSEIPCRIEWIFDAGFIWSVQDGTKYPRIFIDDSIDNTLITLAETKESTQNKNNKILEKDWLERGNNYNIETAIKELAEAVVKHYPESTFSLWYNNK